MADQPISFEARIRQVYDRLKTKEINHFDLLGLQKNATIKEIEAAFQKYTQAFPRDKIEMIENPEIRKMGQFIRERIARANEVLSDYGQKAVYEKRGYRDTEVEKEEDAEEKAKSLYKKAKALHTQKQYPPAIQLLQEAIKLDPDKSAYYLLLGVCQSPFPSLKKDAETNLLKAAEMESWNAEPYVALGLLFYSEKLVKRAETFFRKAVEIEPNNTVAKSKLFDICGPEETFMDSVQKKLRQHLPSVFDRKKK